MATFPINLFMSISTEDHERDQLNINFAGGGRVSIELLSGSRNENDLHCISKACTEFLYDANLERVEIRKCHYYAGELSLERVDGNMFLHWDMFEGGELYIPLSKDDLTALGSTCEEILRSREQAPVQNKLGKIIF